MIAKIAGIDDAVSRMLQSSILAMESVRFHSNSFPSSLSARHNMTIHSEPVIGHKLLTIVAVTSAGQRPTVSIKHVALCRWQFSGLLASGNR